MINKWLAPSSFRRFVASSLSLLLIALVPSRARAAEDYAARVYRNAAGESMPFRLLVPKDYDAGRKYPLVVLFHGAGERGADNQKQLIHGASLFAKPANRDRFPCFVVVPQCPENQQWVDMPWGTDSGKRPEKPSNAMRLALEIIDASGKEFSIDSDRIYATGLSMGGYATWDCITRFPERFAAAAPICGGGDEKTVAASVAKVPVWAFHSEDDNVVKVRRTRNMVKAMRDAGGQPKYFEYFGLGHNCWDSAFAESELLEWMFVQRLGKPDTFALKTKAPEMPAVARFPADDEFPGKGPIRNADWFRNVWRERRMMAWRNREKDKGAIVFLGDSITHGWGSLARDFPNLKVANRGISGDITRGVLYRLKEDVLDLDPKAIVLLIGTNDIEEKAEPQLIADNIKTLFAAFKAHNPKMTVIVCKVMPSHPSKSRPAEKIQKLNALLEEMVKGDSQFIICDTWSIFADADGNAKKEEFPDLLHPNSAGYRKWASALRPILEKLPTSQAN